MKILTMAEIRAVVRCCHLESKEAERKLSAYQQCHEAVSFLVVGYKAALERHTGVVLNIPNVVAKSGATRAVTRFWNQDAFPDTSLTEEPQFFEAYPITGPSSYTDHRLWQPFADSYRRSMTSLSDVDAQFSKAICGAMGEMVDNIIQHSGVNTTSPATGCSAFFCRGEAHGFMVMDCGRGAYASLKTNPRWSGLTDDESALAAILRNNASSRPGHDWGGGYRQLFKALVDREFTITLWSGDALVTLEADQTRRRDSTKSIEHLPGFAIVVCAKKKAA